MLIKTVLLLVVETYLYELPGRKYQKEFFRLKKQLEIPFRFQPSDHIDLFIEGGSLVLAGHLEVESVAWVIDKEMAIVHLENLEVDDPRSMVDDLKEVGWKECSYPEEYKWDDKPSLPEEN
jgi:hypothetical protein